MGSERASVSYLMHFVVGVMSERWGLRNHERRKALVHIRQILKLDRSHRPSLPPTHPTPPHPPQKTQMLCNLEELSGLLCLCSDYYYYLAVVWNIQGPILLIYFFMPFTPSYKGKSYELDESQVSKGRHRKKKHKITVSLNERGSKRNQMSVHKFFFKNP